MGDLNVDQNALTAAVNGGGNETPATTETPAATPSMTELDGISEFTFQGEKYTPDQLHKLITGYKTLSEKSKTYEDNEKYEYNLEADLDRVLERPDLAEKFKQTYPQKYHYLVDKILRANRQDPQAASQNATPALPKEILAKLDRIDQQEQRLNFFEKQSLDAQTKANIAEIDAIMPPLLEKYPMAIEDQVYARAEAMVASNQQLNEKVWERLTRESHEAAQKKADRFYEMKLKSQMEKGQRGADSAPGGSAPGQAPVRPKTFDEARDMMLASLQSQRNG